MTAISSWSMRFALALSSVFTIGAISAGGIAYLQQTRELSNRLTADVRIMADGLAHIAATGDRQDLQEQVQAQALASRDGSTLVAWIDNSTGEVFGNFEPSERFEGARLLDPERDILRMNPLFEDMPDAYEAFAIQTTLGLIVAARDTEWITESGEILMHTMVWAIGTALLFSIALAVVIARRNEKRIQAMEAVLTAVGQGQLDLRIRDTERDDLSRLANNVDATLDRLESGVEAIKQVSTDVAHDLRAPLGRLRLKMEPYATDASLPDPLRHVFGATLADIDDISRTFDSILRLARLQSGTVDLQHKVVDLTDLVREVFEILEAVAEDAGHTLQVQISSETALLTGDRELLSQVLINLVDNAVLHCPRPTSITIGLDATADHIILWVADHGLGIPAEDRIRVRERFVRLDDSRSKPGTGLGLSLVYAIAALHDGQVSLSDNGPGLRIDLTFLNLA